MGKESTYLILEGEKVEHLWQEILSEMDEAEKDAIQVKRKLQEPQELAGEPITLSVCIASVSVAAIVAVTRIVEKVIESHRQRDQLRLISNVAKESPEAANTLAQLAEIYTEVSIAQGSPELIATFGWSAKRME